MPTEPAMSRFEVVVLVNSARIKHVATAELESLAVARVRRSYASADPTVIKVVNLGALPKRRKSAS